MNSMLPDSPVDIYRSMHLLKRLCPTTYTVVVLFRASEYGAPHPEPGQGLFLLRFL